jgi:tetratricopeptide (TPR) repeat protein
MKAFLIAAIIGVGAAAASAQTTEQDRRTAYKHYQVGQELLSAERWEKAADEFRAAIALDALFTDAHYGLGRAFMGMQRYASAAQAYEGCIGAARSLHGLREKDRVGTDQHITEQIRALREAIANIRRQKTGGIENQILQLEARVRELERSKSGLPGPFEPPAEVLLALGSAHFRNGDREAARISWESAVRVNSRLGEAWNNLAVVHMQAGRKAEAEAAVRNAEKAGYRVHPGLKDEIKKLG